MAGHSKFKNIMHRKGRQDRKRAGAFAKLSRELTVAAQIGGSDPSANVRLRAAIAAARAESMPKDNIERAIAKGAGGPGDGANYDEIRYEGYGPGGVALIIETLTDNKNRTASEVRAILSKFGGNLGESGSVNFMFDRIGEVAFGADVADADAMFEAALEAGADDVESGDDGHLIYTAPEDLHAVAAVLESQFGEPKSAKLGWRAQNSVPLDEDGASSVLKLLGALDDNDDVQTVAANFDISEELMERLAEEG